MTRPGSADARTISSSARTALVAAGFGVLALRLGLAHDALLEVVAGVVAFAVAILAARVGRRRRAAYRAYSTVGAVTLGVCAAGLLAVVGAVLR